VTFTDSDLPKVRDFGLCLGPRDAGVKTREHLVIGPASFAAGGWLQRRPEIGPAFGPEARRHDAGHRVRLAAKKDLLSHSPGIRVKITAPQDIAQDDDRLPVREILIGGKLTPDKRRNS
jgi:hypothetical protein